ncbi:MAG TPA: ABC transporter permease [Candidatus Thermoplasmatota archaeon]|nr:ABC transporter permease [Candidatus Thermoplasmatota archaeon]
MNFKIIGMDFVYSVKGWYRSRGGMFWSLAFPIILILLFGAIFSGVGNTKYTLYIQDEDQSQISEMFNTTLNSTKLFNINMVKPDVNITEYIKDKNIKAVIVIPKGFGDKVRLSEKVNLSFYYDPSDQTTVQVVRSVVTSILQQMNMEISHGSNIIGVSEIKTITENFNYIDFFLPGMIGFTIMQSAIYGSIERNTKYRKDGILRKLQTTPITRTEWILAKMLFMMFLAGITTTLISIIGILVFGMTVNITPLVIIIVIATSFLFSGMGMLIGRFVKEEETADTAGGAISFPMMFLAGTFFPLEQMPQFLQVVARVLPLYYVNEGLRNSMIYLNQNEALINGGVVIVFAAVFFISGVILTKWKED